MQSIVPVRVKTLNVLHSFGYIDGTVPFKHEKYRCFVAKALRLITKDLSLWLYSIVITQFQAYVQRKTTKFVPE